MASISVDSNWQRRDVSMRSEKPGESGESFSILRSDLIQYACYSYVCCKRVTFVLANWNNMFYTISNLENRDRNHSCRSDCSAIHCFGVPALFQRRLSYVVK